MATPNPGLYVMAPGTSANNAAQTTLQNGTQNNPYLNVMAPGTIENQTANATYDNMQAAPAQTQSNASINAGLVSQLQGQLGQLDPQQQIGLQNILNSYNTGANRLDQQKAVAQRDYTTKDQQNSQSYANTRNGIVTRTSSQANALQRLLGINGAGNSSAAYDEAPYAAALSGSADLNQAQQTYGNNHNSLDTNWQDTLRNYQNSLDDLNNQRYQQENGLKSSIAQTRANLLSQIGAANNNPTQYAGQVNDLLGQITNLGQQYASPVLRTNDISYAAPTLGDFFSTGAQGQAAQAAQSQGGAADSVDPTFLGLLAGGQRDQFGNLIAA